MTEQFVPYEIAKILKDKGFNEECFGYSWRGTIYYSESLNQSGGVKNFQDIDQGIALPLWQQVFEWLDKKEIFCTVQMEIEDGLFKWYPIITTVEHYEGVITKLKPRGKKIDALTDLLNYVLTILI